MNENGENSNDSDNSSDSNNVSNINNSSDSNISNISNINNINNNLQKCEILDCIVCCSSTDTSSKCCNLTICKNCYIEWLKTSRECMHCHKDQMEFNEWVENHREDTETFSNIPPNLTFIGFSATAEFVNSNNEIISNVNIDISPEDLLDLLMGDITEIDPNNFSMSETINPQNLLTMLHLFNNTLNNIESRLNQFENGEDGDNESDETEEDIEN